MVRPTIYYTKPVKSTLTLETALMLHVTVLVDIATVC
jgi:hypothetical protein